VSIIHINQVKNKNVSASIVPESEMSCPNRSTAESAMYCFVETAINHCFSVLPTHRCREHMTNKKARSNQQPPAQKVAFDEPADADKRSLEQRLWNISQASDGERIRGYVDECELTDDETIRVHIRLPNGEMHTQTFPIPKIDSPKYAFVRIVEECGYSLASAGRLAGDSDIDGSRVWCEPIDAPDPDTDYHTDDGQANTDQNRTGDWRLVVPEYTPPFRERLRARLDTLNSSDIITPLAVAGGFLLLPLIFPVILFRVAGNNSEEVFDIVIFGGLALILWLAVMMLFYTAVLATVV
jgi:hypothetical protein